jgi:hypothetical protein
MSYPNPFTYEVNVTCANCKKDGTAKVFWGFAPVFAVFNPCPNCRMWGTLKLR